MKTHNFGAGPAVLPESVYNETADALKNFNGTGLSLLEISHRSSHFEKIMQEAEELLHDLLSINKNYTVIFLAGGASQHFAQIPLNFLEENNHAAYLDTGVWASNAIKEAQYYGKIQIAASGKEDSYNSIPEYISIPKNCVYFHYTSNNTIYGTTQYEVPLTGVPVICDMSSDILSSRIDVEKFDMIYASAQKNAGPAGVSIIIVKNSLLEKITKKIPNVFNYAVLAAHKSVYNTPPVFSIYGTLLNLRWIKAQGGLNEMEKRNIEKSSILYNEIDRNSLFSGSVTNSKQRSRMNVTFLLNNPAYENDFLSFTAQRNIVGIKQYKGHAGFRASLYNALPLDSVKELVRAMQDFEIHIKKHF